MANGFGDCSVEIDLIKKKMWEKLLLEFDDASINQAWSMGAISFGERNLSHLVLKRGDEVIGMAQISIRKIPIIRAGLATVYWGPLWRRKDRPPDHTVLDRVIEDLKKEYVVKRGFLLRLWPVGFENSEEDTVDILKKHGLIRNPRVQPYRTLLLDLSPSVQELRKNLDQKWRNQLNSAEKSNLSVTEGTSDEMYLTFSKMLHEMISRKKFTSGVDYNRYRKIQSDLPEYLKMKVFVCTSEGVPASAGVFSAIGGIGTYVLGATADKGLKVNGSNLIHWEVIKWLKEKGCQWYDLGGIDSSGNPGVYRFKRGIAGKSGKEVAHLGQYYLAGNPSSYFLNYCIDRINALKEKLHKLNSHN